LGAKTRGRTFRAKLLAGTASFSLGLAAAAWALRGLAEGLAPPGGEKWADLALRVDECDVLVLGSSMMAVGFREEPFEDRLRKDHGREIRACSFSMGGLHGAELDFYVRRALELPFSKLRWLLIDVTLDQEPRMAEKNWYTRREIDWQTPRQFAIVTSHVMARDAPFSTRVETLWPFARHLAINVLNVGRARPALEGFDRRHAPQELEPENRKAKNERRLERKDAKAEKYRRRQAAHEAAVRRLAVKRKRPPGRDNTLPATWRDAAAARGFEVAYVVGPSTRPAGFPVEVPGEQDLRVFDFNDPTKNRRLYDIENRYDSMHLTEPGARLFSRGLADALDSAMDELDEP
jgi:hypothetical protein